MQGERQEGLSRSDLRPLAYSSPLPQHQWEQPVQSQPRRHPRQLSPEPSRLTSASRALGGAEAQGRDRSSCRQRRPSSFLDFLVSSERKRNEVPTAESSRQDSVRRYHATLHTPDVGETSRRAVSQPSSPGSWEQYEQQMEFPNLQSAPPPKSPIYSTTTRRRLRSTGNVADTTFGDDEAFRLFAEATQGLGPEPAYAYRQSSSSSGLSNMREGPYSQEEPGPGQYIVSPIQETPTTLYALSQLAQLPTGSIANRLESSDVPQTPDTQRLSRAIAGVDLWTPPLVEDPYADDLGSPDDELPDYAQSQAEAQAAQRVEAARRAQELQRRWAQSR